MLRGYIDNVTTLGYVEGWAFDTDDPIKPLEVAVFTSGEEVAWGLAHRFRADLMTASYGLGWCAFRLRASGLVANIRKGTLRLVERTSGLQICVVSGLSLIDDPEPPVPVGSSVQISDPTVIEGTWQLQECDPLFLKFISEHGVEAFLGVAYAYMLGRPVDDQGLAQYSLAVRNGTLTPLGVLAALEKSDEFKARGRPVTAPNAANFPFI